MQLFQSAFDLFSLYLKPKTQVAWYVPCSDYHFVLSHCSARWIGNHGFSIGIDDVQPSDRLSREKEKQITIGYNACDQHIQAYNKGKLELQPGCNAAQTLESSVTGELNKIREAAGNVSLLLSFVFCCIMFLMLVVLQVNLFWCYLNTSC